MAPQPHRHNPQVQRMTVALKNICRDYPAGGGILRELLQNADDSGASSVKFILDQTTYPEENLLHPGLAEYQGPALLAYNNATFSDKDFVSLSRIGDSCKLMDGSTTGKFGRGFNSVYNWTDCPSIVSGNSLLVLDPHHGWSKDFGEPGGPVWDFVEDASAIEMKNQMIAFTAAISEFDRPFQGTIIRIPLRTLAQAEKSEICERETTISEVKNVLERFGAEFHHTGLLFMKNVEKISISVGDANPTYIEISNNESVRRNKTTINQMIKRAFAEAVDTFNLSFEIEIEYGQIGAKKQTSFAVHHQIGDNPKDKELREWSKAQAVIPWVAIAAQLPLHTAEPTQGSLFTVLPLPIHINQPVHIHGLFSTSPDRARLHRKGDSSVQDQLPARWNQWLFDTPIPMAWTQMLLHLAQHYPDQSSFGMWPRMLDNPSDECYGIDQKVLRIIDDEKPAAWYTSLGYITLDSGLLASGGESPRLKTVLHDAGVPVIYLTDQLRSSVVKACKPKIMSPEKLCKRLQHKGGELQTLSDENKQTLLDYLVSDPEFCGYGAVELFPFEDGSHRSIDHHIAFVHRDDAEHYLFSREQNFNIDLAKVSSNTLQILQNGCRASSLHSSLRHRSSHDLKAYCLGTLFKQIAPGQDVVSVEGDAAVFIPKVWDWILARGHSILDESISSLWLLPLTNGHYRRVKPLDPSSETIYAPPGETGDFLRKLAAVTATCNRAILLADSLSSKSLQLLIKEAKNDSTLRIRNGTVLEDFVLWLSKIHGVIEIVPSRDKRRVLELIAPRLHLGADPLVVSNALRGLAVFEKAAWKVENNTMKHCPSWVNLNSGMRVVGLLVDIPVPEVPRVLFVDAQTEATNRLLRSLKLADCLSMLDLLQDFIIPAWESQILDSWTSPCKEETAERILRQFHSLRSDCRKSIASLHIVPVARIDGEKAAKFETAARLIDPSIQSLRDLFFGHEEVCPRKAFINKYKGVLIDCGLKTALDEELVEDRVRCFGDGCHTAEDVKIRASRLLQSAPTWKREPHGHRNSVLREIQWLPAADKHGTLLLRSADQCRGIEDRLLVDHVFPVVRFEISRDWRKHLGWDESISDSILHAQLRKGVEQADRMVVNAVLTYIKKKGLDNYGSLMDIPCILTSDGHFDYPRRTFRTGCEMLKPYLRNVDSGFWKEHSQLLGQFGMKNKPALEDLLKIQEELHTPLNESDTTVMIEIIKLSANFPRDSLSSLKIPDTAGQLCAIQEITFDDFGLYTVIDAFSSTHPGIPRSIALKLGIEPLSERVKKGGLGLADVDDDDEFDQREEVATGIADTLERYPVETTFKEYLANADDVGTAHQINWLLDNRNHPKGSLLTPELSDMQGPALMVHNDGTFLEKDFQGLKNVGRGSKRDDSSAIGKFGRGSQTMYHWTDVPMLLSGKYLLILDPLQQVLPMNYIKRRRKPGVKIELSKLRATFPDQLAPFEGLWAYSRELDYYDGTIFRFPLRSQGAQSRLRESTTPLHCNAVRDYMEKFFNEARICLLFLKHIRLVDFKIYGDTQPQWSVGCPREEPDGYFSGWMICTLTREIYSGQRATAEDRWWVAIQDPPEVPSELQHRHKRRMKDVECGMAALVSSESSNRVIIAETPPKPRVFSTLPLTFDSRLPVHIHATFLISGDRQSIPTEESMRDAGSDWNRWLLQHAIPRLYLGFLEDLGRKIGLEVFPFWPQQRPLHGSLSELIDSSFWETLPKSSSRLFPLAGQVARVKKRRIPELIEIKAATFDFLPELQSRVIARLLEMLIPTIVRVPEMIEKRLRLFKPEVTSVTGTQLRKLFCSEAASKCLQNVVSEDANVLETILTIIKPTTDQELNELDGCCILPLENGHLGLLRVLVPNIPSDRYYLASKSEAALFNFASELLISRKPGDPFMTALTKSGKFNLEKLCLSHVGTLLDKQGAQTGITIASMEAWLSKFWGFWHKKEYISPDSLDVAMFVRGIHHPIFVATCNNIRSCMEPKKLDVLPSVIEPSIKEHQELCDMLPGVYRFNRDFMPLCIKTSEDSFESPASFKRLIQAISRLAAENNLTLAAYIQKYLDRDNIEILRKLVVEHLSLDSKHWVDILTQLRSLPLWPAVAPKGSLITAETALIARNHGLLVPWMALNTRLIAIESLSLHESSLQKLDVQSITDINVLKYHVFPNLPQNVAKCKTSYRSLIGALSQIFTTSLQKRQQLLEVLSQKSLAADRNGVLHLACELFDHDDTTFRYALRDEADTKFLLEDVQTYKEFWKGIGLRQKLYGSFNANDYILCLQSLKKRLEASEAISSDIILLFETKEVLSPLISPSSALSLLTSHDWSNVSRAAILPALTNLNAEPKYRRKTMRAQAVANPLLLLADTISYEYAAVCWSPVSFRMFQPTSATFQQIPSKGKPSVNIVWKHLEYMTHCVEGLSQDQVPMFVADLHSTYDYLQQNLIESKRNFTLQDNPIWLNLDLTKPELVSITDLKQSWSSIKYLILLSSCDTPPLMSVRQGLMPYERLLRELGCNVIRYPTITAPKVALARSVSESLMRLRKEGKMLDVTFSVEGKDVRAHKVVLAAASAYCEVAFNGNWSSDSKIILEDLSHSTLKLMIDFAYKETFDWSGMQVLEDDNLGKIADRLDDLLDLLAGADRWVMPELKNQTEDQIRRADRQFVRVDNVLHIQKRALDANASHLARLCSEFYKQNKAAVDLAYEDRKHELL